MLTALSFFLLALIAAIAFLVVIAQPDTERCSGCGRELSTEDEWHIDMTRIPGEVFCRRCWQRRGGAK